MDNSFIYVEGIPGKSGAGSSYFSVKSVNAAGGLEGMDVPEVEPFIPEGMVVYRGDAVFSNELPIAQLAVAGAVGVADIAVLRIRQDTTIYVRPGGDDGRTLEQCQTDDDAHALASLQGAINLVNKYSVSLGKSVKIKLSKDIFYMSGGVSCYHPDSKAITIEGTTTAASSSLITSANTTTLLWNVGGNGVSLVRRGVEKISNLYVCGGTAANPSTSTGVFAAAAYCDIGPLFKAEYWGYGIQCQYSTVLNLDGVASCNNSVNGIYSNCESYIYAAGCYVNGSGNGFCAYHGAALKIDGGTATNCTVAIYGNSGAYVEVGGNINISSCPTGVRMYNKSILFGLSPVAISISVTGIGLGANYSSYIHTPGVSLVSGSVSPANRVVGMNNSYIYYTA
jgi:hypothetical protein